MTNPNPMNYAGLNLGGTKDYVDFFDPGHEYLVQVENPEIFKTFAEYLPDSPCASPSSDDMRSFVAAGAKSGILGYASVRLVKRRTYNIIVGDPILIKEVKYKRSFTFKRNRYFEFERDGCRIWVHADTKAINITEA